MSCAVFLSIIFNDLYFTQADELQDERTRFDEALMAMTERLVDATENMNKLEKETVTFALLSTCHL